MVFKCRSLFNEAAYLAALRWFRSPFAIRDADSKSESGGSEGRTGKKLTAVKLALGPEHHNSFHSLFHQRPCFAVTVTWHGELLDFKSSDLSVTVGHGPHSRINRRCSHRRLIAQLNQSVWYK